MRVTLLLTLAFALAACSDEPAPTPASTASLGQTPANTSTTPVTPAKVGAKINKGRGLYVEILREGSGQVVQAGDHLDVHFRGFLKSTGEMFDSSYDQGRVAHFELGAGNVMQGWERGIEDLQVGTKAKLHVPSFLAYGPTGFRDLVPPNADLIFEVEVVKIYGPKEAH